MTVFVVIPFDEPTNLALKQKIKDTMDGKFYELPRGGYLVAYDGTSKMVAVLLGLSEGVIGTGLVTSASGYWGHASNDIWEWMKQHMSGPG